MRIALAAVAGLVLLCCGCSTSQPEALQTAAAAAPMNCTETVATPAGSRPALLATSTGSWFGAADLWVGLPDHPAATQDESIVLKFPWVTLQGDEPTSALGVPQVSAIRPGLMTPVPASFGPYSQSYGTGGLAFWPATIEFPSPGCWTVSGSLGPTTVEFVVRVSPP
ncbi:hypothetical protein [Pseudonocardia humida]|uniref:Lipoprotein n=1 Tax=Pseudonocardia humida TaxID=2800819 RepID=A0ABT1ADT1_9PSEU|nr:hypothetical protein [Pseudonocardia humida]MCO1661071.1 hypothetical protein [Pseudonocardia humida]